jgi:hypothetical protein
VQVPVDQVDPERVVPLVAALGDRPLISGERREDRVSRGVDIDPFLFRLSALLLRPEDVTAAARTMVNGRLTGVSDWPVGVRYSPDSRARPKGRRG